MDPKYLEELKKLKEQKDADLGKMQELAQLDIPAFDEEELEPESAVEEIETSGETIKFAPITQSETETVQDATTVTGGKRGRTTTTEETSEKNHSKAKKVVLITLISSLSAVIVLFAGYFGIRHANKTNYAYPYWGMGISIEETASEYSTLERTYTFFGKLAAITRYDEIGQIEAVAEFEDGNCIRETVYTSEGDVEYYYTHEYEGKDRIRTAYFESGQMVTSVNYAKTDDDRKINGEKTFYLEENRVETFVLTLTTEGNLQIMEIFEDYLISKATYIGTLLTDYITFNEDGTVYNRVVYDYTEKRQLKTSTVYDAKNTILARTDHQYDEKKGLLKKVIRYDGQGNIIDYDTYDYDLNNNPIKQVMYAADGSIKQQILQVFNDKNRVTKETCLKSDGSIVYCYGYDYDEKGYIKKSIIYNNENNNVIDEYILYQRTESGAVTQTERYNKNSVQTEKSIYNAKGFLTDLFKYNDNGVLILEEKNRYDENQRLIQRDTTTYSDQAVRLTFLSEQYDNNGYVAIRISENCTEGTYDQILFHYTQDGKVAQQTVYDKNGKTVRDETLDDNGRIIKEILFTDGRETMQNEYSYDSENRVTKKKSRDKQTGDTVNTAFTYNDDGTVKSALESDGSNNPIRLVEYNKDGTVCLQINYNDKGMIKDKNTFDYDEEGRVIVLYTWTDKDELTSRVVYYYRADGSFDFTVYDGEGNVIDDSREETEDDAPSEDDHHGPSEEEGSTEDTDDRFTENDSSDTSDRTDRE